MKTIDIELAVSRYFNPRINVMVPNVSWGMKLHECDVLVLTKSGYAYEVEIKTSLADLKRDMEKNHHHAHAKIKRLYFAIPEKLLKHQDLVPEHAGILYVRDSNWEWNTAKKFREAKDTGKYQWTEVEKMKLLRLGCLRIWTLKRKLKEHEQRSAASTASTSDGTPQTQTPESGKEK